MEGPRRGKGGWCAGFLGSVGGTAAGRGAGQGLTVLLHDRQEANDDLGRRPDEDLEAGAAESTGSARPHETWEGGSCNQLTSTTTSTTARAAAELRRGSRRRTCRFPRRSALTMLLRQSLRTETRILKEVRLAAGSRRREGRFASKWVRRGTSKTCGGRGEQRGKAGELSVDESRSCCSHGRTPGTTRSTAARGTQVIPEPDRLCGQEERLTEARWAGKYLEVQGIRRREASGPTSTGRARAPKAEGAATPIEL